MCVCVCVCVCVIQGKGLKSTRQPRCICRGTICNLGHLSRGPRSEPEDNVGAQPCHPRSLERALRPQEHEERARACGSGAWSPSCCRDFMDITMLQRLKTMASLLLTSIPIQRACSAVEREGPVSLSVLRLLLPEEEDSGA